MPHHLHHADEIDAELGFGGGDWGVQSSNLRPRWFDHSPAVPVPDPTEPDSLPVPAFLLRIWEIGMMAAVGCLGIWAIFIIVFLLYVLIGGAVVILFD
jgi:hypothetical protein